MCLLTGGATSHCDARPHAVRGDSQPHPHRYRGEVDMPRTRKDEAPIVIDEAVITGRYVELDGYTVSFETFHTDADPAELFRGLPDDRCQCPHWGYVVSGRLIMRFADRHETYDAGD